MSLKSRGNLRIGAITCLLILSLFIVRHLIAIWQIHYQLTSPFIPASAVLRIMKPHIWAASLITLIGMICLVLYFYERYAWAIGLAVLAIIGQEF